MKIRNSYLNQMAQHLPWLLIQEEKSKLLTCLNMQ